MSQLRFLTNVMYRLKRRYGNPVNIIRITSEDVDLETGVKTQSKDSLLVSRVIVLPTANKREFFYDLAYITGNKDFSYGGLTATNERQFIFDAADLGDWVLAIDQILIYNEQRLDIKIIQVFEETRAFMVTARQSESVVVANVISVSLFDDLLLDDEAVAT